MGELADLVNVPRGRGGQPHGLPKILASLPSEDADDLWAALSNPDTNVPALQRVMRDRYGVDRAYTTWVRWWREVRDGLVVR